MFFTRKINKKVVAVTYDSPAIYLRKSGRDFYKTEIPLVKFQGDEIHVNPKTAEEFGLTLVIDEGEAE